MKMTTSRKLVILGACVLSLGASATQTRANAKAKDRSSVSFATEPKVVITIVDAEGRLSKYDPNNGQGIFGIPNSSAYVDGSDDGPEELEIFLVESPAAGKYKIKLESRSAVVFKIDVCATTREGKPQPCQKLSGSIKKSGLIEYSLLVSNDCGIKIQTLAH